MKFNQYFNKAVLITALLVITSVSVSAKVVFTTQNLINEKAIEKIESIGNEVKEKLNINLHLYAKDTINGKTMIEYREEVSKKYNQSYILLLFAQKEQKVEIISSKDLENKFDKDEILDPFDGTIIPLLITKPKKDEIDDRVSAALLNGYADIADKVAQGFNIELKSSIGNSNRNIINTMRAVFYSAIIIVLAIYFRKKYARKKK